MFHEITAEIVKEFSRSFDDLYLVFILITKILSVTHKWFPCDFSGPLASAGKVLRILNVPHMLIYSLLSTLSSLLTYAYAMN